jgi:tetratricopeptide (TPR) repeat protein
MNSRRLLGQALALAAAAALSACASLGQRGLETRDEQGFTISEKVRAGSAARADFARAVAMRDQGDYASAIALLEQVSEDAPAVVAPLIDLGIAYRHVNELDRAEVSIKKALALNPRHPVAHNELGIVYRKMGRFADARASYEKALAKYPHFHFARRNLAVLCDLYLADLHCAIEQYELYALDVPDDEFVAMWITDLKNRAGK